MKLVTKFRSLYRSLSLFLSLLLVFSTMAPLAQVLADASVPTNGTTGQYSVNPDGTINLTLNGSWTWSTHGNKDCNVDRYAVGWAVDWNDSSEPGNFVGTFNGNSYDTGVRTNANGLNAIDNAVHYYPGPNPPRCGVLDPTLHYPVGNWGPISHVYPAGTTTINACVVTYDVHNDDHTADGIKAGDLIAGDPTSSTSGNTGNDDNSVEGNAPANSGCFAANIQNLVVVKHVVNTGGGTKSASDFTMNVSAVNPSQSSFAGSESGTTVQVGVGAYNVTENNDPNYIESVTPSCSGSIAAGQTIICTITNTFRGTLDICHATSSNSNPYVVNHPAKSGDVDGHDNHNGPIWFPGINIQWGDIIPPFDYVDSNGVTQHYPGKNWDATGQAVFNNGCSVNGTLTVNKVLNPSNDPGKFNLNIDNNTKASDVGNGGTTGAVSLTSGTHNVSETAGTNTALSNYSASFSGDCDTNGNVNLGVAQNLICTITNSRLPSLTLNKTVVNKHGGTKTASDFQGMIDGSNVAWSSTKTLSIGGHTASETNLPGYSASAWSGDCAADGSITLTAGENAACSITNSDIAPSLTITKLVINPYGTPASANSFPLFVDGNSVTNGQTTHPDAGNHTITETQQTGYMFDHVSGDCVFQNNMISISLGLGDIKSCTITNTAIQPEVKVIKHVINDNGGNKSASDFTMTVTGNSQSVTPFPGDENGTTVGLNEGPYTVDEQSHDGYTESFSGDCNSTISIGQVKTCTITNNDIAPTLKMVKHVINDNSGTNVPHDWLLTATGTGGFSDFGDSTTFHNVNANVSYGLSESNVSGYFSRGWSCDGGSLSGSNITLDLGQNVTCTVTNDDTPNPAIHVVKSGPAVAHEGDVVTYTFDVTNVGDTQSLSNITVNDNVAGLGNFQSGDTNNNGLLDKGETWVYTKDYTIPTPQIPDVTNTVTACGNFYRHQVCDTDNHTLDVIHPAINVEKFGPATAFAGDTVTYTFYVTNAGDTPLDGLTVNDNVAGVGNFQSGDANSNGKLDLGETWIYTKQFTIPASQTSDITNTVTACGSDSLKLQVCNTDNHTTTILNPGIHVVKSGPATAEPGQTVTYTFTVTNTGNTPLDSITVNDNVAGMGTYQSGDTNNDGILETTETWIYTANYTIPANQNVSVTNTVTACGFPPNPQEEDELFLNITGHQVCSQDKHTTNIPLVLGSSTATPPKLVNTGENALLSIFAGLAVIGLAGAVAWAPKKK